MSEGSFLMPYSPPPTSTVSPASYRMPVFSIISLGSTAMWCDRFACFSVNAYAFTFFRAILNFPLLFVQKSCCHMEMENLPSDGLRIPTLYPNHLPDSWVWFL